MRAIKFLAAPILLLTLANAALAAYAYSDPILGHKRVGHGPQKVIVLHDWLGDAANYNATRPWLDKQRYTYVFADVRGYGRSRNLSGEFNSEEIAADILRLADYLGWYRFHFIGHSMNGMAGFKTVVRDWQSDRRIKSFVAVTPVTPDGFPADADTVAFLTAAITDDATAAASFDALTGGKLNERWGKRKTQRSRATSTPEVLTAYLAMWLNEDFSEELIDSNFQTPVLVIGGRNDLPGFSEDQYNATIANWVTNIQFMYIDDTGHYPMQEVPVLFATLVEQFIGEHPY